jgi:hypothetical protein
VVPIARNVGFGSGPARELVFENCQIRNERFANAKIARFVSVGSDFEEVTFDELRVMDCCFGAGPAPSIYRRCAFLNSNLRISSAGRARFEHCRFLDVRILGLRSEECEFVECKFTGTIEKSYFCGKPLASGSKRNAFVGNDFREADLVDVGFRRGIDLRRQLLPTGADYVLLRDARSAVQLTWERVIAWGDFDRRSVAIAALRALQFELEEGQEGLLLRRSEFVEERTEVLNVVLGLLVEHDRDAGCAS